MLIELLNKNINVNSKHEFFASTFRLIYSKILKNFDQLKFFIFVETKNQC